MTEFGWQEDPSDNGLIRARTVLGQLRVWKFPKEIISRINGTDFASPMEHRGLYILLSGNEMEAYVGETADLKGRLEQHQKQAPKELTSWEQVIVISDGRTYTQSIFNSDIRSFLEKKAIRHITDGGNCFVVNKVKEEPHLDVSTKTQAEGLDEELRFVLSKLNLAHNEPEEKVPEEIVTSAEIEKILINRGETCKLGKREGTLGEEKVYVRPGSKKKQGWQITLRGELLEDTGLGRGYLLVNRGRCYLIPLLELNKWLADEIQSRTKDIFVNLPNKSAISTKEKEPLDIAKYQIKED